MSHHSGLKKRLHELRKNGNTINVVTEGNTISSVTVYKLKDSYVILRTSAPVTNHAVPYSDIVDIQY